MVPIGHYLFLSAALLGIGTVGVVTRRNVIIILMSVELILNAVNINLVAFSRLVGSVEGQAFRHLYHHRCSCRSGGGPRHHHRLLPQSRDGAGGRNGHFEMVRAEMVSGAAQGFRGAESSHAI